MAKKRKDTREKHFFDTRDEACTFAEGVEYGAQLTGGSADAEVMPRREKGQFVVRVEGFEAECECPSESGHAWDS